LASSSLLDMATIQALDKRQIILGATAAAAVVVVGAQLRRLQWSYRRDAAKSEAAILPDDADLLRVGFSTKKLPNNVDHIIIGSGLSGLYAAALLSKLGQKVLVLEQHYVAGGCTHTFKDKGFEFDTGVHYMGMATQFTAFMDFAAGRKNAFRMERQGDDDGSEVYNEFHAGTSYVHRFRPGPRTFINDLVAKFPQEEQAIRRFFRSAALAGPVMVLFVAKQFMPKFVWAALMTMPNPVRWVLDRYVRRTLSEALTDCGLKDGMLRATISAEFGDYGTVPDEAPYFLHAGILNHYLPEGGFSPVGGSDAFATALVAPIFAAGGAVLVRAPVSKIIIEGGRAVGVEVKNLTVRAKKSVISSAGVEVTYRKLLNEVDVQKMGGPPKSLLASEKDDKSQHVYGFIGFEGTAKELGLPTYNVWSLPPAEGHAESDISAIWKTLFGAGRHELPAFLTSDEAAAAGQVPAFISFPSAKDSNYNARCPGKSTAVLLTEGRADFFGGRDAGSHQKRGEQYNVIKKRYEKLLLNALFRHFPHLKEKVAYIDIGTPLSNEHYLGRAASYGLNQDHDRFLDPSLRLVVPGVSGLYLTGQDLLVGGVFPQVFTALMTVAKTLGVCSIDLWILLTEFCLSVGWRCAFDRTYLPKNP